MYIHKNQTKYVGELAEKRVIPGGRGPWRFAGMVGVLT